eukprot:CAMPEP_0118952522 /NCGR_PEP_ID=MMETSP1169-20130426/55002_1 /TAXON_ID=36882 /ORGANISM="Pyramimonas obovata, Strain CCMP722" /LENGTH=43 /DNA_ID= /DNA_START= /DNA_END= /DNA_ORIENTATION=
MEHTLIYIPHLNQGYWRANANGSLHQVSTWLLGADKGGPSRSL